ncbi:50S ribosomal protein L30 [Candidatus Woesearchaeota archaeon]|nr:MAG: 50S ribosomal protein L30 [Candidatus Woesearchaeota archaeon]
MSDAPKGKADEKSQAGAGRGKAPLVAVVLVRGLIGVDVDIKKALSLLRLRKKFACSVLPLSPSVKGLLQKVKDYVTFGEISPELLAELEKKRRKVSPSKAKMATFTLHPPRGGFEKKGCKAPFSAGGVLGNRKGKMGDLLKRMM